MKKVKHILQVLMSVFLWTYLVVTALALFVIDFVVWLLTFWWDKRLWILHGYSIFWAMFYLKINPFWKVKIEGRNKVKKGQVYVIVSNHQSAFDIVLLYRLYMHFKWVAKRELARVPVIGWNLLLNRHILIDRASAVSTKHMFQKGLAHIKNGSSVLIFPEGTRSVNGRFRRFKEGAFLLAQKAEVPILPVVIDGTIDILPKSGIVNLKQSLTIKILDEIPWKSFKDKPVQEFTKEVSAKMEGEHRKIAPARYLDV